MKSVYLKLDPNFLFFNWIPFWALLRWRSIFVTVERDVCVCVRERERSGISSVVVSLHNTSVNLFLFESVLFSFFTLSFYCVREREIKCYIGGAWFIVLVMPGVQGLAAHLELNIGVCIIIGGISLDALGLFIVISHVCRLNNRAVYSNDLCNSCYSLVIIKLQQPRGHCLTFWVNHVNLCVCWSFLDGSWKISMLLLCKFAYLRIILLVLCVKSN